MYTGNSGTIDYPQGDQIYENNLNCFFKITVPMDHKIKLSFPQFHFESGGGPGCPTAYDWLEIIDGGQIKAGTKKIGKFCDIDALDKTFESESNAISLWMKSDQAQGFRGFVLNWESITKCQCNEIGAFDTECDFDGNCSCRPGVAGPTCSGCKEGYTNFMFVSVHFILEVLQFMSCSLRQGKKSMLFGTV